MFLDSTSILFYTLCVLAFLLGVWTARHLSRSTPRPRSIRTKFSSATFLMAPLVVGIVATLATLVFLITYHPELIVLLLTQRGQEIKEMLAVDTPSTVNLAPVMLTATVWWAYWRSFDLDLPRSRRRVLRFALTVSVILIILTSALMLSRDVLLMPICGLAISYLARRSLAGSVDFRFVFRTALIMALGITLLFFAFAFVRGSAGVDDQMHELVGYTIASYNRLTAVLHGDLRYPFTGRGAYLSSFVTSNNTFNRIIPFGRYMGLPDGMDGFGAAFSEVSRAGLDDHLVWVGAFGYIFLDLGWFSPLFLLFYGALSGIVWNWLKRGRVLGIVLYPCIAFCILFWIGANILLDSQRADLAVAAIGLAIYESVSLKKSRLSETAGTNTFSHGFPASV